MGMTTLIYPPDHYGLTLIIGGAEGKLWDIAGMYSKMAYTLNFFNQKNIYPDSIPEIHYLKKQKAHQFQSSESYNNLDAGSIYLTFQALLEVNRPDEESGWVNLGSSRTVAWKTGTSYGFRDAWAIGTTPEYVVGIWVGNADGEGRPGLTGIGAAAPLMFQVFSLLPSTSWFKTPFDALEKIPICRLSGYKAGNYCTNIDTTFIALKGVESEICPYHTLLHLSADKKYRVTQQCYSIDKMKVESWFILPPVMEWFYRKKNLFYKTIPPVMPGCLSDDPVPFMEFIYPSDFVKIFIPRGFEGEKGSIIFEIAHRNPNASVFWHVDNRFIATTQNKHQISISPGVGVHYITVVDNEGRSLTKKFEIVDK
jgi:penicillin-binding protein 1C